MRNGRPGTAFLAISTIALASSIIATTTAHAADTAARSFREAREYTVRVRTQIETPFIEDVRGSFQGAGFLVDAKRGWIVTNAHVVGQSPSNVEVAFADGEYQPARKVYVDSFADIAVLAIDGLDARHAAATLSCGEAPNVGEPIGAFGHPLGIPFTGSRGIVSTTTDKFGPDLIQIDATVDHGNSGGPVISMRDGRVVGIATAGAGGERTDRLNFATPSKDVCRILDILRRGGSPTPPLMSFAFLRDEDGRHMLTVAESFDSANWPFEPGDKILGVEGDPAVIADLSDFVNAMRGHAGRVALQISRGGEVQNIEVTPVPRVPIVDRVGVMIDGALIAPYNFEDASTLSASYPLLVHEVDPGSTAEALNIEAFDSIRSIDGREFTDLTSLVTYLQARPEGEPIAIVLRRWNVAGRHLFDFHIRELPGIDLEFVGEPEHLARVGQE